MAIGPDMQYDTQPEANAHRLGSEDSVQTGYSSASPTAARPSSRRVAQLAAAFAQEPELIRACLQDTSTTSHDGAREIFEAARIALRKKPRYADLLYHASQAAICSGDYNSAGDLLEAALDLNPKYRDALILAARVSLMQRNGRGAREMLQRALSCGADYPDVHLLLGDIWRDSGDVDRARRSYDRALQLNQNYDAARSALESLSADTAEEGSR